MASRELLRMRLRCPEICRMRRMLCVCLKVLLLIDAVVYCDVDSWGMQHDLHMSFRVSNGLLSVDWVHIVSALPICRSD